VFTECVLIAALFFAPSTRRSTFQTELMMKQHLRTFACGSVVALAMVLGACTERETMASKSAQAYRQAQAKGVAPTSESGHGHDTAKAGYTTAAPDHSAHGAHGAATNTAMDHGAHGAPDHAAHGASNERGSSHTAHAAQDDNSDHAAMQHTSPSTATTRADHSTAQAGGEATQHGAMQHGAMQHGAPQAMPLRIAVPSSSSEMAAVRPDATLRPDDFDAPARISVAEAAKAAGRSTSHDAAPAVDPSGATIYSCPMHPEVTSTTPGTCPKCGMTLVERKKK
jgi:hypothetical protein